jgi:hypothetical protein
VRYGARRVSFECYLNRARRTFSIVDPAGTWAWRPGPAAAVRQGAVPALLPAEAAVQLRAEAVEAELPRRAVAAPVELARCAEAAALPRRAEAELPRRAEAAYQRRQYP